MPPRLSTGCLMLASTPPRAVGARPDRRAFVTFLMFNDSYLPGCLMTAYGLQLQGSRTDRVCLVTEGVSDRAREALHVVYDKVLAVDTIPAPSCRGASRSGMVRTGSARVEGAALTRFAALRLGRDGDLGGGTTRSSASTPICFLCRTSSSCGTLQLRRAS